MKKRGRKRCSNPEGCRRIREEGSDLCKSCLDEKEAAEKAAAEAAGESGTNGESKERGIDVSCRLTELERLQFVNLDSAIGSLLMQYQNLILEQQVDDSAHRDRKLSRENMRRQLQSMTAAKKQTLKDLLEELGKKYGFDPENVAIDDETGMYRDLRVPAVDNQDQEASEGSPSG